jgi:hypothetical protein
VGEWRKIIGVIEIALPGCGRKASWFSASKCVDRELSLAALITLTKALERLSTDHVPRSKRGQLKQLTRTLWLLIESKAMTPIE